MYHHRRFLSGMRVRIREMLLGSPSCAAHSIVVYTGCSFPLLTDHYTACLSSVKQATIMGKRPCSAFLESMSGTSVRIWLMTSVSALCAAKHNTFLYPLLFLLPAVTSFSRNHNTVLQLPFTAGVISGERFSAHLDSMLGTWVKIRAMISGLRPNAANCNDHQTQICSSLH